VSATLQTLDRGLRALDFIARSPAGVSVSAVADHLQVHRAIAYRIVATLEAHHLVKRTADARVRLGAGIAALSRRFAPQLLDAARPVLRDLVTATHATAFLSVAEGEECVVVAVEEDQRLRHGLRVSYQEGTRHPINRGAPGIAILATRPASPDDSDVVRAARDLGYSVTRGQLQAGAVGVSVGLSIPDHLAVVAPEASVGVVALGDLDVETAGQASQEAARRLLEVLSA
jgi:DNA-binding IclR family transcriptional regulator